MSHPVPVIGWRRVLYLMLAAVFFGLGALGAILPGLPTTPFLLLTSYFLIRSSPRLNRRLMQSRFFGPILRDWHEHRGVRTQVKIKTVCLILVVMAVSLYFGPQNGWLKLSLVAVVSVGLVVVVRLPAVPNDRPTSAGDSPHSGQRAAVPPVAASRELNGNGLAASGRADPTASHLAQTAHQRHDAESDS